jgi:hypothetical protein
MEIFTIYTTGIGYNSQFLESWTIILNNILYIIPLKYNIKIEHYSPKSKIKLNVKQILNTTDNNIVNKRLISSNYKEDLFPKNILVHKKHILIDMAHLISYGIAKVNAPEYQGYNLDYLKQFNYIYLGYVNFISKVDLNNLKLFEFNAQNDIITIHHILDILKIVKLYDDSTISIWNEVQKYISKYYRDKGVKIYGDELNLREKIEFIWKVYKN